MRIPFELSCIPVEAVAVIGVDGKDPECWSDESRVIPGVGDAGGSVGGQPSLPQGHHFVVQPRNVKLIINVWLREPGGGADNTGC